MAEVFPLSGHPKCFIPTGSDSFFVSIIDDILEDMFYPHQRESNPNKCFPTILTANSFVRAMDPKEAMDLVDEYSLKRFKKHSIDYFAEIHNVNKMYEEYVSLKPTCFLILGEPNRKHYAAAKIFAESTKRVHLDVVDLVNLEMSRKSQCGKWIYSNLCEGRSIPISIVLHLIESAVRQNIVQQRGYVLSGFPIVPDQLFAINKLPKPLIDLPAMRAPPDDLVTKWQNDNKEKGAFLQQNFMRIPSEVKTVEIVDDFEGGDDISNLASFTSFSTRATVSFSKRPPDIKVINPSEAEMVNQLDDIFSSKVGSIDSEDVIRNDSYLMDIMSSRSLKYKLREEDVQRSVRHQMNFLLHLDLVPDVIFFFRQQENHKDFNALNSSNYSFEGSHTGKVFGQTLLFEVTNNVDNHLECMQRQRERYNKCLHEIGKFVLHYFKESIIKVDTRCSAEEAAMQFQTGMAFINDKMVHIPEWIILDEDQKDAWADLSLDELLDTLCGFRCLKPNLRWMKSQSGTLCPVKLFSGKMERGLIEYAVRYLGHVFLLSSYFAMTQFMANPSRYFFGKPNCRIAFISSEAKESVGITAVLQGLFEASSFNWKDAVSQSTDSALMDIHEEARLWAEQQYNESNEVLTQNFSTNYQTILNEFHDRKVNTELALQNSNISVRERYAFKLLPAGPTDMLYQDPYKKLLEYKFYELYKEKYAAEIAKQVIDWLVKQEHYKGSMDIQESYAQWIIQDAPMTLEFWEELEASSFLPDIVIFILDNWDTSTKHVSMEFKHQDGHDIEQFCTSIKANFPLLLKDTKHIQLQELVDQYIGKLDLALDTDSMHEPKATTVGFLEGSEIEGSSKKLPGDEVDSTLLSYLTQRHIPLISTRKRGKKGALEILENYMGLFKSKPKKFTGEQLEEMVKISQESLQEEPKIPHKIFPDYNKLYKLDIGFLNKAATFGYNEQLRNYGRFSNAEEVSPAEIVTLNGSDNDYDIEALSEKNIVSMKQKDNLRQFPFGNSGKYCPVELVNHKMLRLGYFSHTVEFGSRLYSMSSPRALEEFIKCPFRFTFEEEKAPIPPYRICVLGPAGPNRIYFTKMLARRLNMKPQAYTKLLADFKQNKYPGNSAILGTDDEVYDEYGRDFLQSVLKPLFEMGIILEGFPSNDSQFRDMLYHNMYPELVYIVDETFDEALHYTFVQRHLRWEKQLQYKYRIYLQKLARLTRLSSQKKDQENVMKRLRQQSDDVQIALSNIENQIRTTQEDISGEEDHLSHSVYLSKPGLEKSSSNFLPTYAVSRRSGDDTFSKKYRSIRKVLDTLEDDTTEQVIDEAEIEETEEEIDLNPESPLPTPLEEIMIKEDLMNEAKVSLRIHSNELRNMIKAFITSNIPVIKIPENCARKKCDSKLEVCSLKLRKFIYDQAIVIPPDTAELCLKKGYALYSHFKNFCPIDAYHLIPTNLHFTWKNRNQLYAVIFRNLLYYINGSENLIKFSINPRKFAAKDSPFYLVLPMRVLIIGPVSSGVTTLCTRIASEFNMTHLCGNNFKNVSRHQNKQQYIDGLRAESNLDTPSEMEQNLLVEYLHMHRNDSPNGIILDNYPIAPKDLVKAAEANIAIHIVMIIKTEFRAVWRNWKTTYLQGDPPRCFSIPTQIALLHGTFQKYNRILKKYQQQEKELELFNIVYLKNTASKWSLWEEAKSEMLLCLREIGNYSKNIRNQQVVSISRMNIFRYEFEKRMSPVRMFCPPCLKNGGMLVKYRHDFHTVGHEFYTPACQEQFTQPFGYNLDYLYEAFNFPKPESMADHIKPIISKNMSKINLVQYLDNFYWSCDQHHIDILLNGAALLPPDRLTYPPHVPFLVTNYLRNDVAHDGCCVVSYSDRGTTQAGDPNLAVYYRGKIHLCASTDTALQFLENPHHYYHMKIDVSAPATEDLDAKDMVIDYGCLTPEIMIEALTALGLTRPKHFALNIADSAAVFVGLYLKTVNPASNSDVAKLNEGIYAKFGDECAYLQWLIKKYHQTKNPYIRS